MIKKAFLPWVLMAPCGLLGTLSSVSGLYSPRYLQPRTSGISIFTPFCESSKRATKAQIDYKGNIGTEGNYGCNLMLIQNNIIEEYVYTATFINVAGEAQKCVCWLKIGPQGNLDGSFKGNQVLEFDISTSGSQSIAIDENSQGGCACGPGSVPVTPYGQFASTWLEFDMANASNDGWSGADASCLVSALYELDIPGLQVCFNSVCSTINPGGSMSNAYNSTAMRNLDGIGLKIPPGNVQLNVKVGYEG